MNRRALLAATGAGFALAAPKVLAQGAWPNRQIRLIAPFAPGGSVDVMARVTAQKLQDRLGQTVVVENRSGGNGTVGGLAVAQAAPDGYTFCFSASIQILARLVMRSPGYDPMTDLVPVTRVGQGPLLLIMNLQRPQTTLQEVVADVKRNPAGWSFGVSSLGSAGHLATIEFIRQVGVDVTAASYRGTSPALADMMGGTIGLIFDPMLATLPPVRGGRVKGVAITSAQRSAAAPDIPTTAEGGMPSVDLQSWWALWGPRGLPAEITARINAELATAIQEPDVQQRVGSLGIEPMFQAGAALNDFMARDFARTETLLRTANFQPE